MYHDIGVVRENKAEIRHRVFVTQLKPGMKDEYKRRHDVLVEVRGDRISEGPESNFTIWHARGYIFGYCELVKAMEAPPTEGEKQALIDWETRQLEIMDWVTDDTDWIFGTAHPAIELIWK
jgi:L-rhamnose mutarotase